MIWFITGASRGFGREFAIAALRRGDSVAATARKTATLRDLSAEFGDRFLPLHLDVTDRAACFVAVRQAVDHFGGLDVVVNNAGYGHFGAFEELSEDDLRNQLQTNLFGAVWVTQAALPTLRRQGSGHIIQVSSLGGIAAFPHLSAYHASKWALEAMSESLANEVGPLGVKVTIVEPGGYTTDWFSSSSRRSDPITDYDFLRDRMVRQHGDQQFGDPRAAAQALLEVVDADDPPLRVLFGASAWGMIKDLYAERVATWNDWAILASRAQG